MLGVTTILFLKLDATEVKPLGSASKRNIIALININPKMMSTYDHIDEDFDALPTAGDVFAFADV